MIVSNSDDSRGESRRFKALAVSSETEAARKKVFDSNVSRNADENHARLEPEDSLQMA